MSRNWTTRSATRQLPFLPPEIAIPPEQNRDGLRSSMRKRRPSLRDEGDIVTERTLHEAQDDEPSDEPADNDSAGSSVDQAKEREREMEESGEENAG